ncbi:MAG: hypothetical protein QHH02_09125, partial [Syntrophomonadaceae bacterium]|nr:hypothetical protein [Syntrophomonadaceae bacterium]
GLLWSAGTVAAAIFILVLINPFSWQWQLSGLNPYPGEADQTAPVGSEVDGQPDFNKNLPALNPPYAAEPGTAGRDQAAEAPPAAKRPSLFQMLVDAGEHVGERAGESGAVGIGGARGLPGGPGEGPAAAPEEPKLYAAQPASAIVYEERPRYFSPGEALSLARVFGFAASHQVSDFQFQNAENQSTLTISAGEIPTRIVYQRQRTTAAASPATVSAAVETARGLVERVGCLEGILAVPPQVKSSGDRLEVTFERWLNGCRLAERPVSVTVSLKSGEVMGLEAAASTFHPRGSYPLVSSAEIAASYGDKLVRLELVLISEPGQSGGTRLLVPRYLVVSRDARGCLVETLADAIPAEMLGQH